MNTLPARCRRAVFGKCFWAQMPVAPPKGETAVTRVAAQADGAIPADGAGVLRAMARAAGPATTAIERETSVAANQGATTL